MLIFGYVLLGGPVCCFCSDKFKNSGRLFNKSKKRCYGSHIEFLLEGWPASSPIKFSVIFKPSLFSSLVIAWLQESPLFCSGASFLYSFTDHQLLVSSVCRKGTICERRSEPHSQQLDGFQPVLWVLGSDNHSMYWTRDRDTHLIPPHTAVLSGIVPYHGPSSIDAQTLARLTTRSFNSTCCMFQPGWTVSPTSRRHMARCLTQPGGASHGLWYTSYFPTAFPWL